MHKHTNALLTVAALAALSGPGIEQRYLNLPNPKSNRAFGRGHHGNSTKTKPMRDRKHR
jgi:hypothetical protein